MRTRRSPRNQDILFKDMFKPADKPKPKKIDKRKPCWWRVDDNGIWQTGCDNAFEMGNLDGPKENDFGYCPYCGRYLHEWPRQQLDKIEEIEELGNVPEASDG